jgi:hypothetical protein
MNMMVVVVMVVMSRIERLMLSSLEESTTRLVLWAHEIPCTNKVRGKYSFNGHLALQSGNIIMAQVE